MTQKEFIKVLREKGYSYKIEGDKVVVTQRGNVSFNSLASLPFGVEFENEGDVQLGDLTSLPSDVRFKNEGDVQLGALTSLPSGVEFDNGGNVFLVRLTSLPSVVEFNNVNHVVLTSITSLHPDVNFKNGGNVYLGITKIGRSLIGGYFSDWGGNIEGIDSTRLLNMMIKKGVFKR